MSAEAYLEAAIARVHSADGDAMLGEWLLVSEWTDAEGEKHISIVGREDGTVLAMLSLTTYADEALRHRMRASFEVDE